MLHISIGLNHSYNPNLKSDTVQNSHYKVGYQLLRISKDCHLCIEYDVNHVVYVYLGVIKVDLI